jgi:hypothetical protein
MVEAARQWRGFLHAQLSEAAAAGHELPGDAADAAATLVALGMALNQSVQLRDQEAQGRTARLMHEVAGLE